MSSFLPSRGSVDTLITLSGSSLYSVSGVSLISGGTGALATLVFTSTNLITFYPPRVAPSGIRSGNWQIFNRFGSVTTPDYHTVIETPFVSGINPNSGFSGSYFRLSGSGIRDATGLWFNDLYTGVLTDAIFENSTWLRSGVIPFISGGLNSYFSVKVMSEGGSSVSPRLYYVRDEGLSLSGLTNFPVPLQGQNFLRGTPAADGLEWRTPNQVLNDITGVLKSGGDFLTGNYRITGGGLYITGLILHNTGLASGEMIFRSSIQGGNTVVLDAIIGGISWRGLSYKFS